MSAYDILDSCRVAAIIVKDSGELFVATRERNIFFNGFRFYCLHYSPGNYIIL